MNEFSKIAEGIDINEFEDGYVIYRSEKDKIHYLNKKTVLVLQACTGENSSSDLVSLRMHTILRTRRRRKFPTASNYYSRKDWFNNLRA